MVLEADHAVEPDLSFGGIEPEEALARSPGLRSGSRSSMRFLSAFDFGVEMIEPLLA